MKIELTLNELVIQDRQAEKVYNVCTLRSIDEILADIAELEKECIKDKVEEAILKAYHAE